MTREPALPLAELKESDILLYHGKSTVSKLIRLFDGTDVSHAGLYRADATVAEALGGGLERRSIQQSVEKNAWVRAMRLAAYPDAMSPVAAAADAYLAHPHRYGYEQIVLLALLGATRRLPVTPLLAPLIRKILDGAATLIARLTSMGREPLICSEFVFRCYGEAVEGSQDPYELRIAGVGARVARARAARARAARARIDRDSLLDQLARGARRPAARATVGARRRAAGDRRSLEALAAAYLRSAPVGGVRAARAATLPLAEVEPELMRFAAALARSRRPTAGARRGPAPPLSQAQSARTLARVAADFVTPGDLLKSPSLVAMGRLDLGARAMRPLVARSTPPAIRRGSAMKKYALCIGINDYPGTGSDLAGCVNDAKDWGAAFKARGFDVGWILNRDATGKNLREGIREVIARAKSGDVVAIQYSGHGSFVPDRNGDERDGTDECLCPYDVNSKGPITDDELFVLYSAKQPGVRLVVFSDSCHSGTVARFAPIVTPPTARGRSAPQRKVRFLPPSAFLPAATVRRLGLTRGIRGSSPPGRYGALLMSGCQDTEYSYDAYFQGRPNGAFTFVALDALAKLPKKAAYLDWFAKVRKILPSQQYAQSPNLYGSTSMKEWPVLG